MTNKERYNQYCRKTTDLPLFSRDWYLDAVCENGEWDVAIVEHHGEIVASMPYFVKRKFMMSYVTMPLFTKYLGPHLSSDSLSTRKEHLLIPALIEQLPAFSYFTQNFSPSFSNWLPFYWKGYKQTTLYTYILEDISDLEKAFQRIKQDRRREIRKAQEQLSIVSDYSFDKFYEVHKWSFDRQGLSVPFSIGQLKRLDETLVAHNSRKMFFAVDDRGNIHGACYLVWDETSSYFQFLGSQPNLRSSGASILLTWEAIRFTSNQLGLKRFDFQGSMIKQVEPTMRQFGAIQQPYFKVWKSTSLFAKLCECLNLK
jgi:hypothetical protein